MSKRTQELRVFTALLVAVVLVVVMAVYVIGDLVGGPHCRAEVQVYEDGSWSGARLTYDGEVLDKEWQVARWGWRPAVGETECSLVLAP